MSKKRLNISISENEPRRLLAQPANGDFVAALRDVLKRHRSDGWLTINETAKLADLSVRTLQRTLATEGSTFSETVDEVRAELAAELLKNTDIPLSKIAKEAGYSAVSNFSRAFQRWTDKNPSEYRRCQS